MSVQLSVIYGPGRSVRIQVTPTTTLKTVVVDACAKIPTKPNPNFYVLFYNDKALDLSLPVRFANLPQGAKLTLRQAPQAKDKNTLSPDRISNASGKSKKESVKIALQVSGGGRIIGDFSPESSLWDIITDAEQKSCGALNLTNRYKTPSPGRTSIAQRLFGSSSKSTLEDKGDTTLQQIYQQPVLLILNKEYSSTEELHKTTLRSIGFTNGNTMMRLSFKDSLYSEQALPNSNHSVISPVIKRVAPAADAVPSDIVLTDPISESANYDKQNSTRRSDPTEQEESDNQQHQASYAHTSELTLGSNVSKSQAALLRPLIESDKEDDNSNDNNNNNNSIKYGATADANSNRQGIECRDSVSSNVKSSRTPIQQAQVLLAPPTSNTPLSARFNVPDSFYELSSLELRSIIATQQKHQRELEKGFKLRSVEQKKEQERFEKYKHNHPNTIIRFRFPDLVQVQTSFKTLSNVAELYTFVEGILQQPHILQALFIQPPVQDLAENKDKSLYDAKLTPASVVHVRLNISDQSTMSILDPRIAATASVLETHTVTDHTTTDSITMHQEDNIVAGQKQISNIQESHETTKERSQSSNSKSSTNAPNRSKIPKWFLSGHKH